MSKSSYFRLLLFNNLKNKLTLFKKLLSSLFFLLTLFSYSQSPENFKKIDSLSYLSYGELNSIINIKDTLSSITIIKSYLKKARREKDTFRQARAYRALIIFKRNEDIIKYADSIINLTKNKKHNDFPSIGYFFKGMQLYKVGKYGLALDNFLQARKTTKTENPNVEKYIGVLKSRLGYNEEALIAYRKVMQFYEKDGLVFGKLDSYFNMSDVTRLLKQLDSSIYYCDLGLKLSKEENHKEYKFLFLFNKGATLSDMGRYEESQNFLFRSLPYFKKDKKNPNLAISHFFIGRNYKKLDSINKSIFHLKQMDSVFLNTNNINPELRQGYDILINFYKNKKDPINQLIYVERLLKVDSIISTNASYIDNRLIKEYSRIELKRERERLNQNIEKAKNNYYFKIAVGLFIILALLIFIMYKQVKHKKDKIKFNELINTLKKEEPFNFKEKKKKADLNNQVAKDLLSKLEEFEKDLVFLDSTLNRDIVAKKMNTNIVYLSKTINEYMGKTYTAYINDLRIDYAIRKLKEKDKVFLNYSVRAIANEVGFKNPEPFSKAFFKRTGMKPSFFIKSLKKTH